MLLLERLVFVHFLILDTIFSNCMMEVRTLKIHWNVNNRE